MNELIPSLMLRVGWTLVHSVWQFAILACLLQIILGVTRQWSAHVRYLCEIGTLSMMMLCAMITLAVIEPNAQNNVVEAVGAGLDAEALETHSASQPTATDLSSSVEVNEVAAMGPVISSSSPLGPERKSNPAIAPPRPITQPQSNWVRVVAESVTPWIDTILTFWLAGVMLFSTRLIIGWNSVHRLRRSGLIAASDDVAVMVSKIAACMGVRSAVRVVQSSLVDVPTVIGWLQPMILLPATAMTGLSSAQLEAVIAHELAHIRRHDYLINALQLLVETLFFYHPAIWWVSHRMRVEREECCDDIAVCVTGDRTGYARTLVWIDETRGSSSTHQPALSATGGSLMARVQHIIRPQQSVASQSGVVLMGLIMVALLTGGLLISAPAESPAVDSEFTPQLPDEFADLSYAEAVSLQFATTLREQQLAFLDEADILDLRDQMFEYLAGRQIEPVPETSKSIAVKAVAKWASRYKPTTQQDNDWHEFFDMVCWQLLVLADQQKLSPEQLARRESQRDWMRNYINTLPATPQSRFESMSHSGRLKLLEAEVFDNPLSLFFHEPMSAWEFETFKQHLQDRQPEANKLNYAPAHIFYAGVKTRVEAYQKKFPPGFPTERLGVTNFAFSFRAKPNETEATVSGKIILEDGSLNTTKGWMYYDVSGQNAVGGVVGQQQGEFQFKIPAGRTILTYYADGFAPAWSRVFESQPGEQIEDIEIILHSGRPVTIAVVSDEGTPIPDAKLIAHPEIDGTAHGPIKEHLTDEQGRITLEHLAETKYAFRVSASGFETLRSKPMPVHGQGQVQLQLTKSQITTGTIKNANGTPAAGAKVRVKVEIQDDGSMIGFSNSGEGWWGEVFAIADDNGDFKLNQLTSGSKYMMIFEGADSARLFRTDITAGQKDLLIQLPERRDLVVNVSGSLDELPEQRGKAFVSIRQRISFKKGDRSYGDFVGIDVPVESTPTGGTARSEGLVIDSDAAQQNVEVTLGYDHQTKKVVEFPSDQDPIVTFEISAEQDRKDTESVKEEHASSGPPSEADARAAFEKSGIRANISRMPALRGFNDEAGSEPSLDITFSGKKVTDELMPYLLAFPDVTSLYFTESTHITDETLKYVGQLKNLNSLHLASSRVTGTGFIHLAGCSKLRNLTIKSSSLKDDALAQLATINGFQLTGLSIGGSTTSDLGFENIGQMTSLQSLTLNVGQKEDGSPLVTGKSLKGLFPLKNLTSLEIMGGDIRQHATITDADLAVLSVLPNLTSLNISSKLLTDAGMQRIGQCPNLKQLSIWHALITDEGISHLAHLHQLEALALFGTQVTGTGMKFLAESHNDSHSTGLRHLDLIGMAATDEGLAEVSKLSSLTTLRIGPYAGWFDDHQVDHLAVTDVGLKQIAQLPMLSDLSLNKLNVTDAGLTALQQCQQLSRLGIRKLPITDDGLATLAEFPKLNQLEIHECSNVSREGLEKLHEQRSDLRIEYYIEGRQVGMLHYGDVIWSPGRTTEEVPAQPVPVNQVVDAEGKPIAGARIEISKSRRYSWLPQPEILGTAVTDKEGHFDYPESLPELDQFLIYVTANGFLERDWVANQTAFLKMEGVRQPDTLTLLRPVTISGQIIDRDGSPLSGAEIAVDYFFDDGPANINGNRVVSDENGHFEAQNVPPANVFVRYETPYKAFEERQPVGVQSGTLVVKAFEPKDGEIIDNAVLDLREANRLIAGKVVNEKNIGLPNQVVSATFAKASNRLDESISVKTDVEGKFRFEGLGAGEYLVRASPRGLPQIVRATRERPVNVLLSDFGRGERLSVEEMNRIQWGQPNPAGLVGGLRFRPDQKHFAIGDLTRVELVVRNPTEETVTFEHTSSLDTTLHVLDQNGKSIADVNYQYFTGIPVKMKYQVLPGDAVIVGSWQIGFIDEMNQKDSPPRTTFKIPCRLGQFLRISSESKCEYLANDIPSERRFELTSGETQLTIGQPVQELQTAPDQQQPVESIIGKITVTGEIPRLPLLVAAGQKLKDPFCSTEDIPDESFVVGPNGELKNVFVYLRRMPEGLKIPEAKGGRTLSSIGCRFVPHAQVMQVGEKLNLINTDPVAENVHLHGIANTFNVTLPPRSGGAGVVPNHAQVLQHSERVPVRVVDDFHPWKNAWLLPLDHPFAAVTDEQGNFSIDGLPSGEYEFVVWHERAGYLERRLTVNIVEGEPTKLELSFPVKTLFTTNLGGRVGE